MTIEQLIYRISEAIVNPIVLLLFSFAFLVFLWGVFEFVYNADDQNARENGKRHLFYGVVGMTIMIAAVAITKIIEATARLFN